VQKNRALRKAAGLSQEDAKKLDEAHEALRHGDLKSAAKLGRIFRLTPVN
jgi:hypothetical protein